MFGIIFIHINIFIIKKDPNGTSKLQPAGRRSNMLAVTYSAYTLFTVVWGNGKPLQTIY